MSRPLTVIQLLPALRGGGAERSAIEITAALRRAGHRAIVISAGGALERELRNEGGEHLTLDIGSKRIATWFRARALARLFAELKPDIVHARSRLPAWLGWRAIRHLPPPRPRFLTTAHGLYRPGWWSSIMTRGERVIAVSETVRAHLLQHWPRLDPERIRVIPRGINPRAWPYGYRPMAEWLAAFHREYPALAGGRLMTLPARGTRRKGHAVAIRLLAKLRGSGLDVRLLLLGVLEGARSSYRDELERLTDRLGLRPWVVFAPMRQDIREIYAASALVLQLSTEPEAFGRTVIEALALGRPVLGFAHGGVGELLAELYPPGMVSACDEKALAERALALLDAPPPVARFSGYTVAAMQQATLAVYEELIR